jgi:hypothetical protein
VVFLDPTADGVVVGNGSGSGRNAANLLRWHTPEAVRGAWARQGTQQIFSEMELLFRRPGPNPGEDLVVFRGRMG